MSIAAKNLLRFLGTSALVMLVAVLLNFVADPLQVFRPARLFVAMYSQDSRMQDAGLIRSQDFDTVFMGTSLAIHFRQSDIDRVLGVHSLKLAMTGSDSSEQGFVIATALQRHPKRVIWQVDDWIFRTGAPIDSDIYLPADLYRRNIKGIAEYLFSGAMAFTEPGFFLRFAKSPLRLLDAMRPSAYGIFLVHYPIVLWLQYWLYDYDLPAVVKATIAFVLTVAFSWAVTAILRKIPGATRVL